MSSIYDVIRDLRRLRKEMLYEVERMSTGELKRRIAEWDRFYSERGITAGEAMWVPEEWNYAEALSYIREDDVVFDVGAGDLMFALLASQKARRVYAVEVNPEILGRALQVIGPRLPKNLIPICADARDIPLPPDVTVIVILVQNREESIKWN